ncbi:MAG: hypothetical protein ABI885_22100, partial [Gammaproteobacteria bacterium]
AMGSPSVICWPGVMRVMLGSSVKQIVADAVAIEQTGNVESVRNDAVIVNAGGVLPSDFLRSIGIHVETKYGTA